MHNLSPIGIVLYMILSIVGGGLTGLFAGYMYYGLRKEFGVLLSSIINVVFYIVPVWALIRLFEDHDSFLFYLCLLIAYFLGTRYARKIRNQIITQDHHYGPPDQD